MRSPLTKKGVVVVLAAATIVGGGAWLVFGRGDKSATPAAGKQASGQTQTATPATQQGTSSQPIVETTDFKYSKPAGWAKLSQKALDSTGAASGIGRPTEPVASFSVKVSDAIPKDTNDLKNSTLNELKKFTNFQLVSVVDTKVDGQQGQKFVYNFTDNNGQNKTVQQMSIVPYKQSTFFLLFSSAAADFDKQASDFASILSSFHFK